MNVFRLEGDYWTVQYDGTVLRLRDGKGLQYLAYLLQHPGKQFTALDLMRRLAGGVESENGESGSDAEAVERARSAVGKRIRAAVQKIHGRHASLGRYLAVSVKTGRLSGYLPDPMEPVAWSE